MFGYSQIVNPFYLWRKNGKPGLTHVIFAHWLIHVARNFRRTLIKIPSDRNDRAGRLEGILCFLPLAGGKSRTVLHTSTLGGGKILPYDRLLNYIEIGLLPLGT